MQTAPAPNQGILVARSARGIACVLSTCQGDYWVCYNAECYGDGWICAESNCYGGTICYEATCTPPPGDARNATGFAVLQPTDVAFTAPPNQQLFTCTTVRSRRGDVVTQEQFFGCSAVA